jgi:tetratricopeptide (TPR) repeat protein
VRPANDVLAQDPARDAPGAAAVKPSKLSVLLNRLMGRGWGPLAERIDVRVATLAEDVEGIHTRHVIEAMHKQGGFTARRLDETIELGLIGDPGEQLLRAVAKGRERLLKTNADLLVWGEAPQPGATLTLRFISALPEEEDRPGYFGPGTSLMLPASFGSEISQILVAVGLAATTPQSEGKRLRLVEALPKALSAALPVYNELPPDFTEGERASVRVCMGNAASTVAALHGAMNLYQVAAQGYQAALENISKDDHPIEWATAQRNLGVALQALAERGDDADILGSAADAYRAALGVLTKALFPREWAVLQNRLGLMLYKLDRKTGDTELVKHALSAFQASLQVFTRAAAPVRWADIMNNFAQAAQMLGGELRNVEVLKTSAAACRSVLEVRTREKAPLMWAATQNNLGTALFLIAKEDRNDTVHLQGSVEAFARAGELYTERGTVKLAAIAQKNRSRAESLLESRGGGEGRPKMRWEDDGREASPAVQETPDGKKSS